MPISVKVSGTWKTATPSVKVAGVWKPVLKAWVKVAGVWKETFVDAFTVALDTQTANGTGPNGTVTTNNVTATPAGGTAPYTYAWEYVSGDLGISATAAAAATTAFSATGTNVEKLGTWRCKVTDNLSAVAYSAPVSVDIIIGTPP